MKKKKRKKRKNHFLNIMLTFGGVFTGVMILGILAFLLLWKIGDERADGNSLDKPAEAVSNMVVETIPEQEENLPDQEQYIEETLLEEPKGKYDDILSNPEYMLENNIYAKETAKEKEVTIAFAGDILFDPYYSVMSRLLQRENGIHDSISEDLMNEMISADIMMIKIGRASCRERV